MSIPSEKDDVSTALSLLSDTLGDEEQRIRVAGVKAMQGGEYDTASTVIEFAKLLLGFKDEVEVLVEKWNDLEDARDSASPAVQEIVGNRVFNRSDGGSVIQRKEYCRHILKALVELGGSAVTRDVSRVVNKTIKMQYPHLQAARTILAQEGWTKKTGSNRVWEISDEGRRWLRNQISTSPIN